MMPLADGHVAGEHQIDYKQKYKTLKKKLKLLVYEQECFLEELRKAQGKLLKVSRDKSFLLDRLLQYEKVDDSSGDSDATASSDSEADGHTSGKKRKISLSPGQAQLPFGSEASTIFGNLSMAALFQAAGSSSSEPVKKRSRPSTKKSKAKSKMEKAESRMTREELERHLESRQNSFKIEKAPAMLPMEIFSNDNSNPDSETADTNKEDYDSDLVIDAS
ncbi:uncharacterized protein LOC133197647 isoform X2 [Saccostrea echinata]|uniref:uncharacterized protein LOC133197647 isoform X2 n=1 Tax=Saccostrea echinata TaxID=191078 RepID=UPI002A80311E|nr:uncharacterized protein LOC133197647 isoform X2 [Saccostrea echinata]